MVKTLATLLGAFTKVMKQATYTFGLRIKRLNLGDVSQIVCEK